MAGVLFVLFALCCLFFIFQRLLISLGSLSGVSLLFCLGFFDFLILSNILGYCQTFLFFVGFFLIFSGNGVGEI